MPEDRDLSTPEGAEANLTWPGVVALFLTRGCPPENVMPAADWAAAIYGQVPVDPILMVAQVDAAVAAVTPGGAG